MRFERHVFGSTKGYTTLAQTPGVGPDDVRLLENIAFSVGQTYDQKFWESLSKHPAYFTSVLAGGRRGLTRILAGGKDDENRPTSRMVTVILSAQDWQVIGGDILRLLKEGRLWEWDGSPQLPAIDLNLAPGHLTLPARPNAKVLALLSEAERAIVKGRGIILSATEVSLEEMAILEMLASPEWRSRFTSAYRSLGAQLPVTANCLASESPACERVNFHPCADVPTTPYAHYIGSHWVRGSLTLEVIMSYQRPSVPKASLAAPNGTDQPVVVVQEKAPAKALLAIAVIAVVTSAAAFLGAYQLGRRADEQSIAQLRAAMQSQKAEQTDQLQPKFDQVQTDLKGLQEKNKELAETVNSIQKSQDRKSEAASKESQSVVQQASYDHDLGLVKKEISQLKDQQKELHDQHARLTQAYFASVRRQCDKTLEKIRKEGVTPDDVGLLHEVIDLLKPFSSQQVRLSEETDSQWLGSCRVEAESWSTAAQDCKVVQEKLQALKNDLKDKIPPLPKPEVPSVQNRVSEIERILKGVAPNERFPKPMNDRIADYRAELDKLKRDWLPPQQAKRP